MRQHVSSLIEALGLGLLLAAAFLFDWRAGAAVLGAVLILVGYVIDRPRAVE